MGVEPITFRFQARPVVVSTVVLGRGDGVLDRRDRITPSSKTNNPDGTRTRNPQIRSLIRYPLRHGVVLKVEEQGFEPWAFRMQSGCSTTELHPLS